MEVNNLDDIFENYYQSKYDYDSKALSDDDVYEIKQLVKEKRANYGIAPIGDKIFEFISSQCMDIRFEKIAFNSDDIDGLLYIRNTGQDKAYIVLNSNRPLINQIFASAHEYYHYLKDYSAVKDKPNICSLSSLNTLSERKASRFAAELLLPEGAVREEYARLTIVLARIGLTKENFDFYAVMAITIARIYMLPVKAVIYRLAEEGFLPLVDEFVKNYDYIKRGMDKIKYGDKDFRYLYSNENRFIDNDSMQYARMKLAYDKGLASREELLRDGKTLGLNLEIIENMFDNINDDDEDDDLETLDFIKIKWGKND